MSLTDFFSWLYRFLPSYRRTVVPSYRRTAVPPYRRTAGFALLEVLVALTILASAGVSLVGLLDAGVRAEARARDEEQTLGAADRLLTATTLLTRNDLGQRLGHHDVGEFRVSIQRPEMTLYRIGIAETRAPEVEVLVTVVYRPEVRQ